MLTELADGMGAPALKPLPPLVVVPGPRSNLMKGMEVDQPGGEAAGPQCSLVAAPVRGGNEDHPFDKGQGRKEQRTAQELAGLRLDVQLIKRRPAHVIPKAGAAV